MRESAGRTTWTVLAFIAIAGTLLSLHPLRMVSANPNIDICALGGHVNETCSDGIACTFNDRCDGNQTGAQCHGTANNSACDDFNDCTVDTCNISIGCQHTNQTGTSCDDGDPCTVNDQCNNGACTTSQAVNCSGVSDQCNVRSCSSSGSEGNCDNNNALNNTPCDNGGEVKCQHQPAATCVANGSLSNCTNAPDNDGDHICNADDPRPDQYDPTGYIYNEDTAQIVPGGHVGVACVAGPCQGTLSVSLDGSNGQYAFNVVGLGTTEERYALTITPPAGCVLSAVCLASTTPLDPTGQPDPDAIGNYPASGDPNSLSSNACTIFYTSMDLESGDPQVINNNIPVHCPATSAPTVSISGLAVMALLLTAVGSLRLLRRKAPRV
jgi:hypothetical protein